MSRRAGNWLQTYQEWTSVTEAPGVLHFWSGVAAIAGALRRKVWLDRLTFKWYPSMYIILVAPPGVVNKSTTIDLAMDLLRAVPGIHFGPDHITWQSLVQAFEGTCEQFPHGDTYIPMSPLVIASSELGLLLNMQDRDMVNFLITLWDGRDKFEKQTKMSGNNMVEAPWITLIGATTPKAIAENMPKTAVGGGFTSRCIFVFRDAKQRFVANPRRLTKPATWRSIKEMLIQDLEHISINLTGEYTLTPEAEEWEAQWYGELWTQVYPQARSEIRQAYLSRKQTHLCKLAMIIAASNRDERIITVEDMQTALCALEEVEPDIERVFDLIGKSEDAYEADRLRNLIKQSGSIPYAQAYKFVSNAFPKHTDYEGILAGLIRSNDVEMISGVDGMVLKWRGDK